MIQLQLKPVSTAVNKGHETKSVHILCIYKLQKHGRTYTKNLYAQIK
jgi:hypothetical protein